MARATGQAVTSLLRPAQNTARADSVLCGNRDGSKLLSSKSHAGDSHRGLGEQASRRGAPRACTVPSILYSCPL